MSIGVTSQKSKGKKSVLRRKECVLAYKELLQRNQKDKKREVTLDCQDVSHGDLTTMGQRDSELEG